MIKLAMISKTIMNTSVLAIIAIGNLSKKSHTVQLVAWSIKGKHPKWTA